RQRQMTEQKGTHSIGFQGNRVSNEPPRRRVSGSLEVDYGIFGGFRTRREQNFPRRWTGAAGNAGHSPLIGDGAYLGSVAHGRANAKPPGWSGRHDIGGVAAAGV
ncbi:MAG: hypothetical protein KDA79_25520, partial [Planctomycetaceae bacterium]|nr:hypothetical protein [Planctomycetaceae bacterium]